MKTWFSVDLGDGEAAFLPTQQIKGAFTPLFSAAGCPIDMAVFSRYDSKTNVVTVYFSPSAFELAKMFNGTLCDKPPREELVLLGGDQRSWENFYPTR